MSDAWVCEPETGRYYVQWKSDSGKTFRHYCPDPARLEDASIQEISELSESTVISRDLGSLPDAETNQKAESLDSRFAIITRPARFFNFGRVFKTLWTEPAGGTISRSSVDERFYNEISYGELSFTKMRRFVVVRKRLHSALCLAIYTYGGQGTTKNHVRPQDHAVVYAHGSEEPLLPPDEDSKKSAISIIIEEPTETIDPMSRLDFSRIYTIEHNVKVLKIGRISPEHHGRLEKYFVESIVSPKDDDFELDSFDSLPESERLDSSFKIRKAKFFSPGRVFSALWTDDIDGEPEIRSFVVVNEGAQACTCLRVRTFHNWGHKKPDVMMTETDLEEYGLVYNSKIPKLVSGIKKKPLRVELSQTLAGGEIREPSLLHYKELFPIQHDAKAKDIGRLDSRSQKLLHEYSCEYTIPDQPAPNNEASELVVNIQDAMDQASTVLQYLGDVKEPAQDCVRIRDQVAIIVGLLFTLINRIKKAEDEQADEGTDRAWLTTFQKLANPRPLDEFKAALEMLSAKLVPKDAIHKSGTPLKWTVEKEDSDAILEAINLQKSQLGLSLQNDPEKDEYVVVDQE